MSADENPYADRHVRILAVLMHIVALPLVLLLILSPLAAARIMLEGGPPRGEKEDGVMMVVMLAVGIVLGIYGAATLVVARGLWKKKSWSGFAAVLVCLTWLPAGLLPLSVYGLYALLRPSVYRRWSAKKAQA